GRPRLLLVESCADRWDGTVEDDDGHVVVGFDLGDGRWKGTQELDVERVARFGSVEGHDRDSVRPVDEQRVAPSRLCHGLVGRHGRIILTTGPGSRRGAASSAKSHNSGRVTRGSMISSTMNDSAVRNGERTRCMRASISAFSASGSSACSSWALNAASIPPSRGNEPQSPYGHA